MISVSGLLMTPEYRFIERWENNDMNVQKQQKGFTIIEVVLVLAIAALIFLMIFVALPALQRGQANTARKSDASTIASAINTFRTNSNGRLPADAGELDSYIDELSQLTFDDTTTFESGDGVDMGADNAAREDALDTVIVVTDAKCNDAKNATVGGTGRQAAVLTVLETSAGNFVTFCQNA